MFQNEMISQNTNIQNTKMSLNQSENNCQFKCNTILIFIIFGFIFLSFAMIELITNIGEQSYVIALDYDESNKVMYNNVTYLSLKSKSISIYLLFEKISQYNYTNKYEGENILQFDMKGGNCQKYKYNKQINKKYNVNGEPLNQNQFAIPCGYYPSLFPGNDIRITLNNKTLSILNNQNQLHFNHLSDFNLSKQWVSFKDPLFQDWMEQNVHLNTLKRISFIQQEVIEGYLSIRIQSLNELSVIVKQNMYLVISDNGALGGKNVEFCISTSISCIIMFLFAFIIYLYNKIQQQNLKYHFRTSEKKHLKPNNSQKYNFT